MRIIFSMLSLALLLGCSGTGAKVDQLDPQQITKLLNPENTYHFARLDQVFLSDQVVEILINGNSLGTLGANEITTGQPKQGPNLIAVRFAGAMSSLMIKDEPTLTTLQEGSESRYYLIRAVHQPIVAKVTLSEVTKQDWLEAVRQK